MFRHGSSPRRLPALTSTKQEQSLEIRGDALFLPIPIARRFRPLRTVDLLGSGARRVLGELGLFPAFFGLGEGALCLWRERPSPFFACRTIGHANCYLFHFNANSYINTGRRCAKRRPPRSGDFHEIDLYPRFYGRGERPLPLPRFFGS